MYLISSFSPLKKSITTTPGGHKQYLLNIPKTNALVFGSNSIKFKSIKDWNETIHKIHFSFELLFKCAEFIKLVKSTFQDR